MSDDLCVLCGKEKEDSRHLWYSCDVTVEIASRVLRWQGISVRHCSLMDWWMWFAATSKKSNNIYLSKLVAIMGTVYYVWKLRNDVIFNGQSIDIDRVAREIIEACKLRMMIKLRTSGRRGVAMMRRLYGH